VLVIQKLTSKENFNMRINKELAVILSKLDREDAISILTHSNPRFNKRNYKYVEALARGLKVENYFYQEVTDGYFFEGDESEYRVVRPKRICNGVELDSCLSQEDAKMLSTVFYVSPSSMTGVSTSSRPQLVFHYLYDRGMVYNNEESALKHFKAILNTGVSDV
jgi:hypothetical protein